MNEFSSLKKRRRVDKRPALGHSIFTEADDVPTLHENVRNAVRCHFEEGREPRVTRLHFVREDVLAL